MEEHPGPIVAVQSNGKIMYRASGLGSCMRALVAARQEFHGYEPPERMAEVFRAGQIAENVGADYLRARGYRLQSQVVMDLELTDLISISGHVDALARTEKMATEYGVEYKSQSESTWDPQYKNWELWPKYAWQISAYMHASGREWLLVQINRDTGRVITHLIEQPPHTIEEIRERVLTVERLARGDVRKVECVGGLCPYFYLHDKLEPELLDDPAMEELSLAYARARDVSKGADTRATELRKALLEGVGDVVVDTPWFKKFPSGVVLRVKRYEVKERVIKAGEAVRVTVELPEENDDA